MTHHNAQPCRINGIVYQSQREAAKALGVCPSAISLAIREGRENNVRRFLGQQGNQRARRSPVAFCGKKWPSQSDAARDLGVSRATIRRWTNSADAERMMIAVMQMEAPA